MNKKPVYRVFDEKTRGSVIADTNFGNNVTVHAATSETRNPYWPGTYESQRPYDSSPSTFKETVKACRSAYISVGIVRNVIDLMTDFACEDLKFIHQDKKVEAFFKIWSQKVQINNISSEFVRHSLLDANVIIKRYTAKLTKPIQKQWDKSVAKPDIKIYKEKDIVKDNEIPIRYTFFNILSVDWKSDDDTELTGKKALVFRVNPKILTKLRANDSAFFQNMYKNAPDIAESLKKNGTYEIDMSKVYVSHNKKDSWDDWAVPFLYSVIRDIKFKDKLRQAEFAALDGVINVIRIWKLGDHKEKILPAEGAIDRLVEILENNTGGGAVDIIWDSMIDMKDYYPPVKDILGAEKYEQINKDILVGLGIPEVLLGGGGANFSNSFIQLKTVVERLKAIRQQVMDWLNYEISLVCQAMGFVVPPKVTFGEMNLDDENVNKKLVLELLDRGAISLEAVLSLYGEDFLIETERIKQEKQLGLDIKSPLDQPVPTEGQRSQVGRPNNSKDTQKRQRKNIKIRTNASLLVKAFDYIDMIDEYAIPKYMETMEIANARKLTIKQKEDVDELRILLLSCINPNDEVNKEYLIAKMEELDKANSDLYKDIKNTVQTFIEENKTEPTMNQKKRLQAVAWASNFTENDDEKAVC